MKNGTCLIDLLSVAFVLVTTGIQRSTQRDFLWPPLRSPSTTSQIDIP